jgi:hypothetical protein
LTGEFFVKRSGGNIFVFVFLPALKELFDTGKLLGTTKVSAQMWDVSEGVVKGYQMSHSLVSFSPWHLFAICV